MRKHVQTLLFCILAVVLFAVCPDILPSVRMQGRVEAAAKLSDTELKLAVKESAILKVTGKSGTVKWSSSNKKVAAVKGGKVTAKKAGKATITAKVGKTRLSCKVTVSGSYKSIYRALLEKGSVTHPDFTTGGEGSTVTPIDSFSVLDIDKNGMPELVISNSEQDSPLRLFVVFTVKHGEASYCGGYGLRYGGELWYSGKYKAVYQCNLYPGGMEVQCLHRLTGGKLKIWKRASSYYDYGKSKTVYDYSTNNGTAKEINEKTYQSVVKKYFEGSHIKVCKGLSNTAANRKKVLG
ncbi:MAG: Ig domain-containing protein [Hominisplanchenecus sp.]